MEWAAGHEEEGGGGAAEAHDWLSVIFTILPGGVGLDGFDGHFPQHSVAAGDSYGEAGQGHQGVHEIGVGIAPDPGMHSAHRSAHAQAEVVDAEMFGEESVICQDHIIIGIFWESHVQAGIAGFAGVAVADGVGEDDIVFRGVEGLAGFEEVAGEELVDEVMSVSGGPVHDEYGVRCFAGGVFYGFTEGSVVQGEGGEGGLAALEGEIGHFVVTLG